MTGLDGAAVFAGLIRLGRRRLGGLTLSGLLSALTVASAIGLLATSAYLISRAAQRPPVLSLMVAIVAVRAFALARALLRYGERLTAHEAGLALLVEIRTWFYERLEPRFPAWLGTGSSGDVVQRLVGDVDGLQDLYVRSLAPSLAAFLVCLAALFAARWLLPEAATALAGGCLAGAVAVPVLAGWLERRTADRLAAARGGFRAALVESLRGAQELAVLGAARATERRLIDLDARLRRLEMRRALAAGLGDGLGVLVSALTTWAVLLLGLGAVRQGRLEGVLLGTLALLALGSFEAILPLADAARRLVAGLAAGRRLFEMASLPPPVTDPARPVPGPPSACRLTVERARLRYAPNRPWALDGVDLELNAGARVALVGPSGAGKTTLAQVLVRFRELDGGVITLDGHPLQAYRAEDVRRAIGLLEQEPHLFTTNLLENLRLARPGASMAEIEAAAARARILAWVRSLPAGWETPVGEAGVQLSAGQRQRIALARALLAGFRLLILDEPFAHLDPATARALADDLLGQEGPGVLLITHRLYGMERLDEIVVLEEGRVTGRGTHDHLLATHGLYRWLWTVSRAETGGPGS
ncbi:MAG TPA: thiol reductant ABC exporter subunit CydC [Candidatus Dormibacteraeota bacterium]|nr:thiol reductant ABC exporter subunit CydC [Candidatus Dormibacteraeota bacterium]